MKATDSSAHNFKTTIDSKFEINTVPKNHLVFRSLSDVRNVTNQTLVQDSNEKKDEFNNYFQELESNHMDQVNDT